LLHSGIGLGTCTRLIKEFLQNRPSSQNIHLIITTRSPSKSSATLSTLRKQLVRGASVKSSAQDRVSFSSHEVDLCVLSSVLELASTLNKTYPYLNAIICNAGIMGIEGVNWVQAVRDVLLHPIEAVTWPAFNRHSLRTLAKRQVPVRQGIDDTQDPEPPLGDIFTANVFGHYILVSHISPLLAQTPAQAGPGRIIWTSSIETAADAFDIKDIQCLNRRMAYSSSKRLTDLLALTSNLPSTGKWTRSFYSSVPSSGQRPEMYLSHPGVVGTDILPLPYLLRMAKLCSFYIARWLGSPWHPITTYKGAVSTVWLALMPTTTLQGMEERDGKGKWGSATDFFGDERVLRTEVEGWGYGGTIGSEKKFGRKGRRNKAVNLTLEQREHFEELGAQAWAEMEKLRLDWEKRLQN
jgi:3-keto steroid reductase